MCTNELFEFLSDDLTSERPYATPLKLLLCKTDEPRKRVGAGIADQFKQACGFANSGPTTNVVNSGPSTCGLIGTG